MAGWRELFPEPPDSALSDVGLLLLQRGLLECCPARQRETLGWFWMMKLRKEIGTTSMKSAKIWWNLTSSIDIRLHWSFFLNQLPRLEFMDPRRMAAEEAVEHPYFQEAQGSIKRLPYNVGLTGASSFFSSKCPWALGSSMDPCNMNLYESYAEAEWGGRIDISRMLSTYRISCLIFSERFLPFWSPFWLQS